MRKKRGYNPILLDILKYTEIEGDEKKGYFPKKNRHIIKNNPTLDIADCTIGNDYLYVSREKKRFVFVFQPTDSVKDWINDFSSGTGDELHETGIHKGFKEAFDPFIDFIVEELENVGSRKVFFTGHSRGGALTQLGAMISGERGYKTNVITSGAPRLFNKVMRDHYALLPIHCTNLINVHDIVPALPPKIMGYYRTRSWKVLKPKWWYMLPFSFIKIHLDYNSNLKRYTK